MKSTLINLLLIAVILCSITVYAKSDTSNSQRPVIGVLEIVLLQDLDIVLKARIDTGAGVSSINADIIEIIKGRGSKPDRVKFGIKDHEGNVKTLERNIQYWMNIKKKGSTGFIKRPVVKMDFCLGGKQVEGRVNLADRSDFIYPLLIGRNIMKAGDFIVDPEKKYTHAATCKQPA